MRQTVRAIAVLVGVAGLAGAAPPEKIDTVKAESGFIDDPFAFSDDGNLLAFITTDGATASKLHFVVPGGKVPEVAVKYPSITPERIDFLDGERVLVVERNPETRLARGQIFTRQGLAKEKLGPAQEIALATVAGTPAIVSYLRSPKGPVQIHTFTALRRSDGKPLARKAFPEDADGRISVAGKRFKVLFFADGYATLVAQKEGDFDAQKDIRKPDAASRVDVFGGKILEEREIPDVIAWATLTQIRQKHQNEADFVQFSDDLRKLLLYDREDRVSELKTPQPLHKYDPTTLASQHLAPGLLALSLTVDPVNPDAVRAEKADQDWLDLYKLDVKERRLVSLARIAGLKRPSSWRLAGNRIGILRKHKGFARGGPEMEIFDLIPRPAPPPQKPAPVQGAQAAPTPGPAAPAKGAASPPPVAPVPPAKK
ncbi:MAG: hypothetical protein EXR72_02455 [Myxococcales bacterium]|nr:hypothetical protein [Myxococcales bacterium]